VSERADVLRAIEEGLARGQRMALATIVSVRGSTYRREGARLLVPENGKPVGNISGGCLEGDVRATAAEVMKDGTPRLVHFDLTADDEVVWGWGLGCNGVVDVFIEPADGAATTASALRKAIDEDATLAVVTVVEATGVAGNGPGPIPPPGHRILVRPDGSTEGTLGDAALDDRAAAEALRALADERSGMVAPADGVRAFVEALVPPPRLLVCGAGHDAIPLVGFMAGLGWRVEVIDDRPAFLKARRFPGAARLVQTEPGEAAGNAGVDDRTYVVVMSHNFLRDKDYLRALLASPARFVAMLGPAVRTERIFQELQAEGTAIGQTDRERVRAPAGLDLGAEGAEEIATAICAEIVAVKRGRGAGFLKDRPGPIHDRRAPAGSNR
jgi:xanthine dehydrogenase accessory factor